MSALVTWLFRIQRAIVVKTSLFDVRMHDLRHSFASLLINSGRTLYEVQHILGHTQIKTTQRYAHLSQDTLLAAAEHEKTPPPCEGRGGEGCHSAQPFSGLGLLHQAKLSADRANHDVSAKSMVPIRAAVAEPAAAPAASLTWYTEPTLPALTKTTMWV